MYEHLIAKGTIHGFLNQRKCFSLEELHKVILKRKGILRVSMGVTVKDYLNDLEKHNKIFFKNEKYYVSI